MPIGEAANPCPQTWIAEKTFTDFFSSFNKQSFSVLGGTTTSPNWLEEKVWGKGKGIWLLSTQWNERPTQLIPPMKKKEKKLSLLCVRLIVDEDEMCGNGMRLYTVDWSVNGIVWVISLSLCVQSVIGWMEKIVQTRMRMIIKWMDWKCSLETMSPFFLRLVWQTSTCLIAHVVKIVDKLTINRDISKR